MDSHNITSNLAVPKPTVETIYVDSSNHIPLDIPLSHKSHAIVLNTVRGLKQEEYLLSLVDIIDPKTIKFASYISRGRFCIHLSSKHDVDKLVIQQKSINIGEHKIQIKRLIESGQKIVVSNAFPEISNECIEEAIKGLGINIVSPIECMKAGLHDPRLAHILSHRRQLYINPEDLQKLPSSLVIQCEGKPWKLFFSSQNVSCYICNGNHLAAACFDVHKQKENQTEKNNVNTLKNSKFSKNIKENPQIITGALCKIISDLGDTEVTSKPETLLTDDNATCLVETAKKQVFFTDDKDSPSIVEKQIKTEEKLTNEINDENADFIKLLNLTMEMDKRMEMLENAALLKFSDQHSSTPSSLAHLQDYTMESDNTPALRKVKGKTSPERGETHLRNQKIHGKEDDAQGNTSPRLRSIDKSTIKSTDKRKGQPLNRKKK